MFVRISPLALVSAICCAVLVGTVHAAVAQPVPPPPTVQGGQSSSEGSSAAEPSAQNDRLFDAINANDLDHVKQAVQAGADVNARNAFGTSAIDLAVDLGRYDIAFYLMSFRKAGSAEQPERRQPEPARAEPQTVPGGFQPSFRLAPQPPAPVTQEPIGAPAPEAAAIPPPSAPPMPPGADPSGGEPVPSKGFLGFGPKDDKSG